MSRKPKRGTTLFDESLVTNDATYMQYVRRFTELAISMFEWKNLPDTVDPRYMEYALFINGAVVYFRDEEIGDLCLDCITKGQLNVYGYPIRRRAYSRYNNYTVDLTEQDSVIIWNNMIRTNSVLDMRMYAKRLYNLDRIIDVNANAQKTPVLVQATEKQRLTMLNLYQKYEGNEPFIFGDVNLDLNNLKVLKTDAPYIADKIYTLKTEIWNEALTHLGISNVNIQKKERLVRDEVQRNQGGTIASRFSRLSCRQAAAEKINKMFGTNIEVDIREDVYNELTLEAEDQKEGDPE